MKKSFKNILSAAALLMLTATSAFADGDENKGIVANKTVVDNGNGKYTLTLETYAEGEGSATTTTVSQPLDIVLVLDVSGSMGYGFSTETSYTARSSQGYSYDGLNNKQYFYQHTDGEYYPVARIASNPVDSYQALASKGYTPNDVNDNEYYYLHTDNKYYKVSRSGGNGARLITFKVGNTTWYLDGTKATTNKPSTHWGTTTVWTGVLYKKVTNYTYYLSYTVNENEVFYLSGNSVVSTVPAGVNSSSATIWTGVLYQSSTTSVTRLDALKSSVKSFIDTVSEKSNSDVPHEISIVTFNGSTHNVSGLSHNFSDLKVKVDNLSASGGTKPSGAMDQALTILKGVNVDRKSSKMVLMFTDGVPAGQDGDPNNKFSSANKTEANNTISKSYDIKNEEISYTLNDDGTHTPVGITVFSVGIFTNPFADIVDYMDYVSSNYPSASDMDSPGSAATEQKYSFTASSAQELENIFKTIASTSTEGAGSTSYTKENSDVRDFITPQFKLAEGQDVSAITVQYVPCNPINNTTTVDWLAPVPGATKGITAEPGKKGEDGITPVIIKGYDFKEEWVGAYMEGTQAKGWHEGGKLVITIDIELDPEYEAAGVITTNTEDSGIYYDDEKEVDFVSTGITFPVPMTVNKEYALLHIVKAGLGITESAIFDVKVGDSIINTVMVNALTRNEAYVKVNWLTDAAKAKSFDSENPLTESDMIKFTVEERTDWSWNASTPSPASTSALYTIGIVNGEVTITPVDFKFGVGDPKTNVAHDEESVVIKK